MEATETPARTDVTGPPVEVRETPTRGTIAHLTSALKPFDTRVFHRECSSLARKGYRVYWVVPGAEDQVVNGVQLVGVPRPDGRLQRFSVTSWHLLRRCLELDADLYQVHDADLIVLGAVLRALGKRVVYEVHETYDLAILDRHWIPKPLRRPLASGYRLAESSTKLLFDGFVSATERIHERFRAGSKPAVYVGNLPILEDENDGDAIPEVPYAERPPHVAYLGVISRQRGIVELVRALELLPDSLGARLVLAGEFGDQRLEEEVRAMPGWERVDFRGWVSREESLRIMKSSRVGAVLFHPTEHHLYAQPNKVFEYLLSGLPVVGANLPVLGRYIEETGGGFAVDPFDVEEVAEKFRFFLEETAEAEQMLRRGQAIVRERFHWGVEEGKFLEFYDRLLGGETG